MDSLVSDLGLMSLGQTTIRRPIQASYTFPEYHVYVAEEIPSMSWHESKHNSDYKCDYDTNIMGSFTCMNRKCSNNGWSSKRIAITIRLYRGNKYNATVYNQRCKSCNKLGSMSVDTDSYAERVVYRLKKWLGMDVETPTYSAKKSKGPHESSLCEGCKAGHCTQGLD